MSDALLVLAGMNIFAAIAVAAVMALRLPARRAFGARIAYGLWALVPLAALAILLPSRVERHVVQAPPVQTVEAAGALPAPADDPTAATSAETSDLGAVPLLAGLWLGGCAVSLGLLAWRQRQFARAARAGRAGPAAMGVLKPRIVTPDDFEGLYTDRERLVVLAHERTHIARQDTRVNAAVALARCAFWFNPAAHVLAHFLRIDQELACDAEVVATHPQARKSYAQAMLKTQLAALPLPLGCHWPAEGAHPLAARIRLLTQPDPSRAQRRLGSVVVGLLAFSAVGSAWAAKPAHIVTLTSPTPSAAARPAAVADATARPTSAAVSRPQAAASARPAPDPVPMAAPTDDAAPPPAPYPVREVARAVAGSWASAAARPVPASAASPAPARGLRPLIRSGSAVDVTASTVDPDGVPLSVDTTFHSSNPLYRTNNVRRSGSRYGLYTTVFQHGERLWVTASLTYSRSPVAVGSVALAPGETGRIELPTGQAVTVTATQRPETDEEVAAGQAMASEAGDQLQRVREGRQRYLDAASRLRTPLRDDPAV